MLPGRTKAVTHTAPVRTTVLAQPLRDPGLRRVLLLCESNSRAASLRGATGVCVSTPGSQRSQKAFLEERTQDSKYVYQAQENLKLLSPQSGGKLFYKGEPERIQKSLYLSASISRQEKKKKPIPGTAQSHVTTERLVSGIQEFISNLMLFFK